VTKPSMSIPGLAKSTMTQRGQCCCTSLCSASTDFAGRTVNPKSRAVPVTRLVKIMSSHNTMPAGSVGSGACAGADMASFLDSFRTTFAGANTKAVLEGENKDLAVADAAFGTGAAGFHDGIDGRLNKVFVHGNLQLHLTQQVHG